MASNRAPPLPPPRTAIVIVTAIIAVAVVVIIGLPTPFSPSLRTSQRNQPSWAPLQLPALDSILQDNGRPNLSFWHPLRDRRHGWTLWVPAITLMEQQHANSAPVHQISPTSSSAVTENIGSNTPSSSATKSERAKRPNIHLDDYDEPARTKRIKRSLQMEEFKLDGSENQKPQSTGTAPPSSAPVVTSPVPHEPAAQPSCSSDADTTVASSSSSSSSSSSASKIMRARSMKTVVTPKSKKALNEPPVNLITLKELDLKEILNNPRLRHDIYFDAALHFRPNLDGQRGQKKKAQADNYWENIVRECEAIRRNQIGLQRGVTARIQPKRLMLLLDTMRDILLSLVPTRDQKTVEQVFDQQLMIQQLEYGLLNFEGLATWLAGLLKAHCAPMRDTWVDDMVGKIKDGVARDSPRLLVEGLRSVFGILEAMKLDVANHQIRTLRPYLDWYHELVAKRRAANEAQDYLEILTMGVLERLAPSKPHLKPPATFTFDLERLEAIRFDIREDVNMKTCLLLFRSLVSGLNKSQEVEKDAYAPLTTAIQAINGDEEVSERWQRNSPALALQIAQAATSYAHGKTNSKSFPDAHVVSFAESWLGQHLRPQSALYQSFERKVISAIGLKTHAILKAWAHQKNPEFDQLPNTVMGLPADFASIPQQLAKILNLHWRVFEKLYVSAANSPTPALKADVALSAVRPEGTSSEASETHGYPEAAAYTPISTTCTTSWPMNTAHPAELAPPPSYAPLPAQEYAASKVHTVIVGGDAGLVYSPQSTMAAMGDVVEFHFMKQNHSVTQSSFLKPCVRLPEGVDSGLMPNPNNTIVPPPVFKFTVKTTEPTWFYCKQRTGTHCGKGMVFAINPTAEKSFDKFRSMAIAQNGTDAAPPPPVGVPTDAVAPVASNTVTLVAGNPSATNPAQVGIATTVSGNGNGAGGACQCQCFCGVAAYPAGVGMNNYGGMPGALPAPWATSTGAAAAATDGPGGYYKI
ncbi:hypothetical protein Dda_8030 [Drechslerella dactyloides]|uniref:Uncharacterized protein n=1 Tax=Drechslerella dactyloides TaxID=74499 RepID=A0AAD6IRE4_DREDA|nr:hypothetical protein Dda_8030 [Drechslerella dactyloides]